MTQDVIRVAMWSGPRNISTAMMRAWENRADTAVVDEPFYACYLSKSGVVHPMQNDVLASQATEWQRVIEGTLSAPLQEGQTVQYQKHMTLHMIDEIDPVWFSSLRHAFLIRHPAEVVFSYAKKRDAVTAADVGFQRQRELFEMVCALGTTPPVIESNDVLKDPSDTLGKLCDALRISFDPAMLQWPAGRRDTDGVWAAHWYQNVEQSTGFAPYSKKDLRLTPLQQNVVDACLDDYYALAHYKL